MIKTPEHIEKVYSNATCVYTTEDINRALKSMAEEISGQLANENPIIICVMIGGLVPMGHLLPLLDFPLEVDYVHATRYRGAIAGGEIEWRVKPCLDLKNRTILVVDDILDGGITLNAILSYCREAGAKSVYSAVLVDKIDKRVPGGLEKADFVGLEIEDRYIFGFGMDYHEYLRNAPGIYMCAKEDEK